MSDMPAWWQILNLEASQFEKSRYADENAEKEKFRLKDLGVMRQLSPGVYEAVAQEVKEHNEYVFQNGKRFNKYKLGKKIGSIPLQDAGLQPELMHDHKAQDKYFQDHPEMKCR